MPMPVNSPKSIAEGAARPSPRLVRWLVFLSVAVLGTFAAAHYAGAGLTLSHYDARGHLVVARRTFDSLTPGWRQIGAVWLPLPHLLDIPGVWWDWGFRTGYPATAISILALAGGLAAFSSRLYRTTRSAAAAMTAPLLVVTNPNVLYLASTPMTEPLLLGLAFWSVAAVDRWISQDTPQHARVAGAAITCLALTRYEGWCIAAALVALASFQKWRALQFAWYLGGAIAGFLVLGRATTGVWFVTSGFFEPDVSTLGSAGASLWQVWRSTLALGGWALTFAGAAGAVVCLDQLRRRTPHPTAAMALVAAAALPAYAFFQGHPHRIRYMVPLVAASGALAALLVAALPRRTRALALVALAAGVWVEQRPIDSRAPMVLEAQWEAPFREGRTLVTAYLHREFDGTPILASMGSLGHYMQETSHAGFRLRDFLHEGNGDLWKAARDEPERHVKWVLMEERAEGGDELALRARRDPTYLADFTRVAEGGGLVLYRRGRASASLRSAPEIPR